MPKTHHSQLLAIAVGSMILAGCAQDRYRYGVHQATDSPIVASGASNPIQVGGEHPHVDRVERVVQAPGKAIKKWVAKFNDAPPQEIEPEQLRQDAIENATEYLVANQLQDVNIDVRRYEPAQQWARIRANEQVAPSWKYTVGTLSWLRYTLLPGRAFHQDNYNPFSNTLNLNSTEPNNALYEAALAKEYRKHKYLGSYAASQYVPFVPLVHHTRATSDVLTYAHTHKDDATVKELYAETYANIGKSAVSEALFLVPAATGGPFYVEPLINLTAGSVGKITGKVVAKNQVKSDADHDVSSD